MTSSETLTARDYASLGEFRFLIRRFLHFSEEAARAAGLEPQQHQMLLAIRALTEQASPTIGMLAEHLLIRHNSAVGLVDRLQDHGWVERVRSMTDRREVRVALTAEGERKLQDLSVTHRQELRNTGPMLAESLRALLQPSE